MVDRFGSEREACPFSAFNVLNAIADALVVIRREDHLTFADMAAVLGTSEDQAAKYCAGSATMNAVTYARGKREWGGRFCGAVDRLCDAGRVGKEADRARGSKVLKAALALSIALEDDNQISPDEVRANRAVIEQARDALDDCLKKLTPQVAA